MALRCWFGGHTLGGIVARGSVLHVKCADCDRISPGVVIDGPRPKVTQPATKSRIWWLRAVYERNA